MPNPEQIKYIFDKLDHRPTPEQWKIHLCNSRTVLVCGGEQAGKSDSSAKYMLARAFEGNLYWLVGVDYEQTRPEFDYLCQAFTDLHLRPKFTKQVDPGRIEIPSLGIIIKTISAKDPRKIAREAPDGILACEAAQLFYEDYLKLRGRIAPKRAWLLMSGTLEGSLGWYPEMFERGQVPSDELASFSLPTWTNTILYPGGRTDPEILALEAGCSSDWFSERYGGKPVPPKGRVFTEFKNAIHTSEYEFDKELDVHLFIDPGYAHYYAVEVVQKRGQDIYVVDEIYETGLVTSEIITICQKKPWWNKVVGGAIDVAALQHQAMPAVAEIWSKEGRVHLKSQKIKIQDGIERLKQFFKVDPLTGKPSIFINTKCRGLISELGGAPSPKDGQTRVYKWKMNREGDIIGDTPEDKNCDAIKAVIYGLVEMFGYSTAQRKGKIRFF